MNLQRFIFALCHHLSKDMHFFPLTVSYLSKGEERKKLDALGWDGSPCKVSLLKDGADTEFLSKVTAFTRFS